MNLTVDHETDTLYLTLSNAKIVESDEVEPGIIFDYDAENRVVGIEMLNLSFRAPGVDTRRVVLHGIEAAAATVSVLREEPKPYEARPG